MQQETVKQFVIHGSIDYVCLMDDRRIIIDRTPVPPKNDFLWKTIDEVFAKYKNKLTFELNGEVPYPDTPDDKYHKMKEINPALIYLKKKFQTEIY